MDFAAAGLLDGLDDDEREARVQLLERLAAEGYTPEELRVAAAENRLALLPLERVLGGKYTAAEIEQHAGLPASLMIRLRRLLGLPAPGPDDRVFSEADVAAAQSMRLFLEAGLREQGITDINRVLGEAMARVAATTARAFTDAFLEAGDSELEVAWRFATLAEQLVPAFGPVLFAAYTAQLRENVRRAVLSRAELAAGQVAEELDAVVCFADLVGFTALGGEVDAEELGDVVGRFGELAAAVGDSQVRLVKTIGDAAMLVCPEPRPLVDAALSLLEAAEDADLPSLRAGVAFGRVLPRAGDLYGHAVNLASRVTGIARPGTVLCTQEVRDAAPEDFDWSFAGRYRLKGIGDSVALYRARRLGAPAREQRARRPKSDRRRTRASS